MATKEQYNHLISNIEKKYEILESYNLETLVREKELGSQLSFIDAKTTIIKTIELFKRAKNIQFTEVPYNLLNNFHNQLTEAISRFSSFVEFNPNQNNPVNQRNTLIQQLESQFDNFYQHTLPILTTGLILGNDLSLQQAKLDSLINDLSKQKEQIEKESKAYLKELEETLNNAEAAAAQVGVSKHSTVFKTESDKHEEEAIKWLKWTIGLLVAIALMAIVILYIIPNSSSEPREIVQFTITKLVLLSTLFYGLSICSKNYKAHKHNSLLNQHRQNALTTFETFSKAASTDQQTKNAVLLEATHTIFSNQQTGYLHFEKDSDSSNKIVEIIKSVSDRHENS